MIIIGGYRGQPPGTPSQDITDGIFSSEDQFVRGMAQVLCDTRDAIAIPVPDDIYDRFLALASEEKKLVLKIQGSIGCQLFFG